MNPGPDPARARHSPDGRDGPAQNGHGAREPAVGAGFFGELAGGLVTLVELQADRLRLTLQRSLVRAALGLAAGVFVTTWIVAATLAVLRGVRAGMTSLSGGSVWLGELSAGLLALVLLAVSMAVVLQLARRHDLARLKAKYERSQPDPRTRGSDQPTRNGDRRGVPPAAGARDAAGAGDNDPAQD